VGAGFCSGAFWGFRGTVVKCRARREARLGRLLTDTFLAFLDFTSALKRRADLATFLFFFFIRLSFLVPIDSGRLNGDPVARTPIRT